MTTVLNREYHEIANRTRNETVKNFYRFAGSSLTYISIVFFVLYFDQYINNLLADNLLVFLANLFNVTFAIVLLYFVVIKKSISVEYRQWKSILERDNLSIDDFNFDLPFYRNFSTAKIYILARSWFKINYPDRNVYYLNPTNYQLFGNKQNDTSSKNELANGETGKTTVPDFLSPTYNQILTKDLKYSNLFLNKVSTPFITLMTIIAISAYLTMIYVLYIEDFNALDTSQFGYVIFFWTSFVILIVVIALLGRIQIKYYTYNPKIAKEILNHHGIEYSEDNFHNKVIELIEKNFPFVL